MGHATRMDGRKMHATFYLEDTKETDALDDSEADWILRKVLK
jgi:hypothetical protein